MPNLLKKFVISILIGATFFLSLSPFLQVKAQEWYSQNPVEWYLKVYDQTISPPNEIFGERYTAAQVQWVIYGFLFMPVRMLEQVVGENSINCFLKQFGTGATDLGTCVSGAFQILDKIGDYVLKLGYAPNNNRSIAQIIFDTSGRDISGIGYTKSLINKLSPVSEVKAQGFGYSGLTWVQKYWGGFRDIAYTLLVVVVIVFAFMIMFRVKLSPQTVISVQSALPKVVVAMILITFSYAIAGFAIDSMYMVSGIFAFLLKSAGFATNITAAFGQISGTGFGYGLAGGFWVFFEMLGYTIMFFIAAIWAAVTSLVSGLNIFGAILGIVFMLGAVWVLILCIWYTFKVPFVMIKTLISIYLSIITAPVQILAGTISPSMGFGMWFRRLMADILVFPIIGLLFWFAWATLWSVFKLAGANVVGYYTSAFGTTDSAWVPDIIGSRGLGHNAGLSGIIFLAISFGMITLIPKVPELLKSVLLGEKFSFGSAIGEITGVVAPGSAGARAITGVTQFGGAKSISQRIEAGLTSTSGSRWSKAMQKQIGGKPLGEQLKSGFQGLQGYYQGKKP